MGLLRRDKSEGVTEDDQAAHALRPLRLYTSCLVAFGNCRLSDVHVRVVVGQRSPAAPPCRMAQPLLPENCLR